MGSRDLIVGANLSNAVSLAASFNTGFVPVRDVDNIGFTIETTGVTTNDGTFIPQVRILKDNNNFSGWIDLTLDTPIVLANADISVFVNLNQLPPCQVRIKYTQGSSTPNGTVVIWASGKGV